MDSSTALKVLSLEDSIPDFEMICDQLTTAGYDLNINRVETKNDFSASIRDNQYDIILADFNLPGFNAYGALQLCRKMCPDIPFICVSGSIGEETAIDLLKLGAVDYVLKDRPERLPYVIKRALSEAKEKEIRRKAEEALIQSEENFHRSISESPLGIRIVSVEGKTVYANKAFLDIYGFGSLEEFSSVPSQYRYTPESYIRLQKIKEQRNRGQEVLDYEISIVHKSGEIRQVKIMRKEVMWNGVQHYQFINQDITDQKKLISDLIVAKEHAEESDRLKSAFLANISHEIRTPMNGILGFAELLKTPELGPDVQRRYIKIIEQSGARMLNIINDLMDISKIEAGLIILNIEETNVNRVIKDSYEFYAPEAKAKGLKLNYSIALSDENCTIQTDSAKLTQVITNLIKNALKFTKSGSVSFGYAIKGDMLEFYVQDTGVGIPADQTDMIFVRFRQGSVSLTRAYEGAGLGLSISKAFIEKLGGKIWVESELGKGSVFYFQVPYVKPVAHISESDKTDTSEIVSQSFHILIVEDDETSMIYEKAILQNENAIIIEASNGLEALEAIKNYPEIDLVLMDMKMPQMDGYKATRQIKILKPELKIIAITAYAFADEQKKARLAGCDDYLTKPIKKQVLLEKIHEFILN